MKKAPGSLYESGADAAGRALRCGRGIYGGYNTSLSGCCKEEARFCEETLTMGRVMAGFHVFLESSQTICYHPGVINRERIRIVHEHSAGIFAWHHGGTAPDQAKGHTC
jgi:hypothetical protein